LAAPVAAFNSGIRTLDAGCEQEVAGVGIGQSAAVAATRAAELIARVIAVAARLFYDVKKTFRLCPEIPSKNN